MRCPSQSLAGLTAMQPGHMRGSRIVALLFCDENVQKCAKLSPG